MRELAIAAYRPYVSRMGRRPAPMTADYDAVISRGSAWVAEQTGELVGLMVLGSAEHHLMVDNVAVAPAAQGAGVGSRLLHMAEEHARMRGLPEVRLYTNEAMTENLAYYPRRGYLETHRGVQHGFRRVFFTKFIDQVARREPLPSRIVTRDHKPIGDRADRSVAGGLSPVARV